MSGWQPIETAPKTCWVLLAVDGEVRSAFWGINPEDPSDGAWVIARQLGFGDRVPIAFVFRNPTHWMPLPEPPHAG